MSEQIRKALAAEMAAFAHRWVLPSHEGPAEDCKMCQRTGAMAVAGMSDDLIAAITQPFYGEYSIDFTPPKEDG